MLPRARGDVLTHEEYTSLGGVEGITFRDLKATLSSLSGATLLAAKLIVTSLIQVRTGTRLALSADTLRQLTNELDASGEVMLQLFDCNVLTLTPAGLVTLASDAVVKLDIVQQWVREDYDKLKLQADLEDLAQKWDEVGRPENLLPRGDALSRYRNARVLGPLPTAFLEAAERAGKKAKNRSVFLGLSILGAVVILFGLGAYGIYELVRSRSELKATVNDARTAAKTLNELRQNEILIRKNAELEAELKAQGTRQTEEQQPASVRSPAPVEQAIFVLPRLPPSSHRR